MDKAKFTQKQRRRRRQHVRNKVRGSSDRPRMCIDRTLKHIGCQIIDDSTGKTLVSVSTREKDIASQLKYGGNRDAASAVGKIVAERALANGVTQVRFDRGHCQFHGRAAALADAAREGGLTF